MEGTSKKVQLSPSQGVSLSRYQIFFANTSPQKDTQGKMIATDNAEKLHVYAKIVDSYLERELKVAGEIQARKEPKEA